MTKREAHREALNHAAVILETTCDDGWPFELHKDASDEDCSKLQAAMQEVANGLGRRFARLVAADVRRKRRAVHTTPEAK